jgi:uncharacterized protein YjbI with pentapeptide repeats
MTQPAPNRMTEPVDPGDLRGAVARAQADPERRQPVVTALARLLRDPGTDPATHREALELLTERLRAGEPGEPGEPPWSGVTLDLSGATLPGLDLTGCHLARIVCDDTRFAGAVSMAGARIEGVAVFSRAVFEGPARFAGARFAGDAAFGRVRFRAPVDFAGARFGAVAWFGRGEDEFWEDDEVWETIEQRESPPWAEPNEADPGWPLAVLVGEYQGWTEGGTGARFAAGVSFRRAHFTGPAWFCHAQFTAAVDLTGAVFEAEVHLTFPGVELTGARCSGDRDGTGSRWPLGWAPVADPEAGFRLVPEGTLRPEVTRLVDPDPEVALAGLRALGALGDSRPELRAPVVAGLCAWLRRPVPFDLAGRLTADQVGQLRVRRAVQSLLGDRLRAPEPTAAEPETGPTAPGSGPGSGASVPHWAGMDLDLLGAVLVELDLTGCRVRYATLAGAQFHGVTRFDHAEFEVARFRLGGGQGRAVWHAPASWIGARFGARATPGQAPEGTLDPTG